MQASNDPNVFYTCLYSRQSPEKDSSGHSSKFCRIPSEFNPQSSNDSILSDAFCIELLGKTCDEAEKAKIERLKEKRKSQAEMCNKEAAKKMAEQGNPCCAKDCEGKCKDLRPNPSFKSIPRKCQAMRYADEEQQQQQQQQDYSVSKQNNRWQVRPRSVESFVNLDTLERCRPSNYPENVKLSENYPNYFCKNKIGPDCNCPHCKTKQVQYEQKTCQCQCRGCIQKRIQDRANYIKNCRCATCQNDSYNRSPDLQDCCTQTSDLPYNNMKDYQCKCPECLRKKQTNCGCCSLDDSDNDSLSSNYMDLPYQNCDDYMDLIEELEEKLVCRNRNRVRKTMMEFESRSRQNKPLDKPIVNHDEISESDEPILENLSEIKRRKQKPMCSAACKRPQSYPSERGDELRGKVKNLVTQIDPTKHECTKHCLGQQSPLRFKWKMNQFGEWTKVGEDGQCHCKKCNCRKKMTCRKVGKYNNPYNF